MSLSTNPESGTRSAPPSAPPPPPPRKSFWWTRTILIFALAGFMANAWIPLNTFRDLENEGRKHLIAHEKLDELNAVMLSMVSAETGERGFILTGDTDFLHPHSVALASLRQQILALDALFAPGTTRAEDWIDLKQKIERTLDFMNKAIAVRQKEGFAAAVAMVESGEGRRRMELVRSAAQALVAAERRENAASVAETRVRLEGAREMMAWLTAFDIVLFGYAFFLLRTTIVADRRRQAELRAVHADSVQRAAQLLRARNAQALQSRLVDILQSALNLDEAYQIIEKLCAQIFPRNAGALYIRSDARDYFERVAAWGESNASEAGFEPGACWSARNGHLYRFDSLELALPCGHVARDAAAGLAYLCVPMSSNGEMTGILTLFGERETEDSCVPVTQEAESLALSVVEKIGLAVANMRLRDTLRHSSIIDPLTGLYNRRYFEETLRRELGRAERTGKPVGLMLLDVDHFKRFNDSYGHEAGDLVLREVGRILKDASRKSDFACRYGGEEFVLVMPDAGMETMLARAEAIRAAIRDGSLSVGGRKLEAISASIGLAVHPAHGISPEDLTRAADEAMYRAKAAGRDRVVAA